MHEQIRTLIKRDFDQAFAAGIDAILTPATPSSAFGLGEMANADPVEMYLADIFTVLAPLAGLPGISLPLGKREDGLPFGVQLMSQVFEEQKLFSFASTLMHA